MVVTGDVMLGRTVNTKTISKNDFNWAFRYVADDLREADIAFINLESPITEGCPTTDIGMIFCGDKRHIEGLLNSGIDIASLANNHAMNYGIDGLESTERILNNSGIRMVGYRNPQYYEINDLKIGLLAYDDVECYGNGVACADESQILEDILNAKDNSDLVIIMYSWGSEYRDYPTKRQIELAHFSIDSGADLVLGNHPHWYQPVEIYKDKVIMYSHGNFIFDQMWSERTKEGLVGEYYFYKDDLVNVAFKPVYIEDYGQVKYIEDEHGEAVMSHFEEISLQHYQNLLEID